MKRTTFWRLLALGYLVVFALLGWATNSLIQDPPDAQVYERGAFRCDHSWRLPCDGG
jgi:hypothetical protein